ncbi:MAG: hypoxanthine phosphoribosyltransferase [Defluviitaleaceae bacterium]|nr:hypoxanthine phosphoribosyltransferase [Defluviitaleaceae bacterium]
MQHNIDVLISQAEIEKRIEELATEIKRDFNGESFTLVGILKGSVMFMVDLAKKLDCDIELDFMDISSYGAGKESSGVIQFLKDLEQPITGKNVLIVEDIVDTGRTLSHLIKHLKNQEPNILKVCTLLDKPERRVVEGIKIDYTGFVIPDKFVIGYGLDYDQKYRNLPYIGVVID